MISAQHGCQLIGVPFDGGSTLGCPGSRYAPEQIRRALQWMQMRVEDGEIWSADVDDIIPFGTDTLVDGGDIEVVGHDLAATGVRCSNAVSGCLERGRTPIVLGGDDSLLFPAVRGLHDAVTGTVGLIHFDAHLDLLDENADQGRLSHSSGVRRCLELPRFRGDATVQVGVRNFNFPSSRRVIAERGITEITAVEVDKRGMAVAVDDILRAVSGVDHVFLSFDIDAIDPAHAPGAGAHEPGGLTSRQAIDAVRALAPHCAGMAVTEVNPLQDHRDMTSTLAAYLVFTFASFRFASFHRTSQESA